MPKSQLGGILYIFPPGNVANAVLGRHHQGGLHCKQKCRAEYPVLKKMKQEAGEDQQEGCIHSNRRRTTQKGWCRSSGRGWTRIRSGRWIRRGVRSGSCIRSGRWIRCGVRSGSCIRSGRLIRRWIRSGRWIRSSGWCKDGSWITTLLLHWQLLILKSQHPKSSNKTKISLGLKHV